MMVWRFLVFNSVARVYSAQGFFPSIKVIDVCRFLESQGLSFSDYDELLHWDIMGGDNLSGIDLC